MTTEQSVISQLSNGHVHVHVEIHDCTVGSCFSATYLMPSVCTAKHLCSLLLFISIKVVALLPSQETFQSCLNLGITRVSLCVFKCTT